MLTHMHVVSCDDTVLMKVMTPTPLPPQMELYQGVSYQHLTSPAGF